MNSLLALQKANLNGATLVFRILLGQSIRSIDSLEIRSSSIGKPTPLDDTLLFCSDSEMMFQVYTDHGETVLKVIDNIAEFTTQWELESNEYVDIHEPSLAVIDSPVMEVTEIWRKLQHGDGDYLIGFVIKFDNGECVCIICDGDQLNIVDYNTLSSWVKESDQKFYLTKHAFLT